MDASVAFAYVAGSILLSDRVIRASHHCKDCWIHTSLVI